ncbi:hypothetical protein FRB90_006996 [Tulasnella sp. 427]|nr:hypothetical protein FRB90_006996 [Tulasnella sp. 427]
MSMFCLRTARLVTLDYLAAPVSSSLLGPRSSLRSLSSSLPTFINTTTRSSPCRRLSVKADSSSDLFDYTTGRWIYNDAHRQKERRRVFNVDELSRLAAESVNRSPGDIVSFEKLAEGGFNRTFLITMRDNFRLVARIPYPITVPKSYAVASEVATMDFLRSYGVPIPKVYGYSPTSDNMAETEYIFMQYVDGTNLSDIWFDLGEQDIISVVRQLVDLEAKMMSVSFPAGGSLYYTQDLEKMAGKPGILLKDERFCVGPDLRYPLWYGRRSQLDINRGPYESAESALVRAANKELAYLRQFGQPLLPFNRHRREAYKYQEQSPLDHIENLHRYLLVASSLIPKDPSLSHFRIRHPDLQEGNVVVSRSSGSGLQVVSLLDWQHAYILPAFLLAAIPQRLQNYDDPVSQSMTQPSLPEGFNDLSKATQSWEQELYRRRLVHYHYVKSTEERNEVHQAALAAPMDVLRRRLFQYSGDPWEGETISLKVALVEATKSWEKFTGDGASCPVVFDTEDVRATMELNAALEKADALMEVCSNMVGFGPEGWVPIEHYEEAMARSKNMKQDVIAQALSDEERAEIEAHWVLDNMDGGKYM